MAEDTSGPDPPAPATNVHITWEQVQEPPPEPEPSMAVSYTGVSSYINATSSGNTSVAVPDDTTLAIVVVSGWHAGENTCMNAVSLNAVAGTRIITDAGNDSAMVEMWRVTGFSDNGNRTLAWTRTAAPDTVWIMYVVFFGGVDTANPIRDSDLDTAGTSFDITLTTVSGDMCLIAVGDYANDPTTNESSQTEIVNAIQGVAYYLNIAYRAADDTSEIMTGTGSASGGSSVAIAIKQAAAGGVAFLPIFKKQISVLARY